MRKDVKRSLVLWPLFASLTIIIVTLQSAGINVGDWVSRQFNDAWVVVSGTHAGSSETELREIEAFRDFPLTSDPKTQTAGDQVNPTPQMDFGSTVTSLQDSEPLKPTIPAPTNVPIIERTNQETVALPMPRRVIVVQSASHRLNQTHIDDESQQVVSSNRPQLQADIADDSESPQQNLDSQDQSDSSRATVFSAPIRSDVRDNATVSSNNQISINTDNLFADSSINSHPALGNAQLIEPLAPELPTQSSEVQILRESDLETSLLRTPARDLQRNAAVDDQPKPEDRRHTETRTIEQIRGADEDNPATWPTTPNLSARLKRLVSDDGTLKEHSTQQLTSARVGDLPSSMIELRKWTSDVQTQLNSLRNAPRLGSQVCGPMIQELERLSIEGAKMAENVADREMQIQWLQAAFAIHRRVSVWNPIWKISNGFSSDDAKPLQFANDDVILDVTERVRHHLRATGDQSNWQNYLLLDQIDSAARSDDAQLRTQLARQLLNRMNHHQLSDKQLEWLSRPETQSLAKVIRPWATTAVDYAALLSQIEQTESNAIDLVSEDVADTIGALRFASNDAAANVSHVLDSHYRNANVRVALNKTFLVRMLPKVPIQSKPVRTNILGSRVTGMSQIESDLGIQLVPDSNRWSILLQTIGQVQTNSIGRKGPAAVSTAGQNRFVATTPIHITARGATVGGSNVEVNGKTRLRGIHTDFDDWPLIGTLAYTIAEGQYREKTGIAQRLANRRVRQSVTQEVDETVNAKMRELSSQFSETILGPLNRLELEPKVIDLATTEQRLVARYRMASDLQLAAFTPRPRAPSKSLVSIQVHQSAINNTLQQLIVQDEPTPLPEVLDECMGLLGINNIELPDDIPTDVRVRFAKHRPVTFEIEDGKVWLTMRVIRLERGKRVKLSNFIVRAAYRPVTEGLNAYLMRDGHLSISGPGMSMRQRLPVRAIFNKVLSTSRTLPLTSEHLSNLPAAEQLAITQLELRDGWIGLAIGDRDEATNTPAQGYISDKYIATRLSTTHPE